MIYTKKEDIARLLEEQSIQIENAVEVEHSWVIKELDGKKYKVGSYIIYTPID